MARTPVGRVFFQRFALPYFATARAHRGGSIDALLLMDAFIPQAPLRGLSCTSYVHDILPLTASAYWSAPTLRLKQADFWRLKRADVRLVASTSHNAALIQETVGMHGDVVSYGCGQLTDRAAENLLDRGPGPRSSTILYIGALDPRKNVTTLIEAFRSAKAALPEDAELLIIGRPRDKGAAEILRAVEDGRSFGVSHRLSVSKEEALELIDSAGALVLPSADEGFGLSLLEALACGTPAIASDIPAIRSWAGTSLIYAQPGDAAELAAALVTAMSLPDVSRAAGQQYAAQFRWARFAHDLLEIAGAEAR